VRYCLGCDLLSFVVYLMTLFHLCKMVMVGYEMGKIWKRNGVLYDCVLIFCGRNEENQKRTRNKDPCGRY